MKLHNFISALADTIMGAKKISSMPDDWSTLIDEFALNIDEVNWFLPRDVKKYNDEELSDLPIPKRLGVFVAPNSITITGDSDDNDFRVRGEIRKIGEGEKEHTETIEDRLGEKAWTRADWKRFCTLYKAITGDSETITLAEARADITISNTNRCNFSTVNGKVAVGATKGIVPWEISIKIVDESLYLDTLERVVERTISDIMD